MVATKNTETLQVIRADESYTIPEFCRRTGLGSHSLTMARKAGLRVVGVGLKRFVRGTDWLDFLDQAAEQEDTVK